MPIMNLVAGDYDINTQGQHICDDLGFAIVLESEKQIELSQEDYDRIEPIVGDYREVRGLNRDGSQIEG